MKDRSLFSIILFVFIVHALAILWLISIYTRNPLPPSPKTLVVKTLKLSPPPQIIALEPSAPLTPPKVEPIPELKPAEVKPTPELKPAEVKPSKKVPPAPKTQGKQPKKTAPSPSTPAASPAAAAAKAKQKDLLTQAKEKMGKIHKGGEIGLVLPSQIESLQSDVLVIDTASTLNVKEAAYRDELAYRLKLLLKLPKYGEVKLRLTVDRSGKVSNVKVLSFQNEENKTYLENALPQLKLPPFGSNFSCQEEYIFTITLSNES